MKTIREGEYLPITVRFQDAQWLPKTPNPIHYRIDCNTTGQVILDWTDLDPSLVATDGTIVVTVTSGQNAIISSDNPMERKELTVEANYGLPNQFVDSYQWNVKNIQGIT